MTFTFGPSTSTSYMSPRSTMSIPSSGSSTWRSASTTSSRVVVVLTPSMYPRRDFEPQNVGAVVVARRIEPLPLFEEARKIELHVEDRLRVIDRPGKIGAVRR